MLTGLVRPPTLDIIAKVKGDKRVTMARFTELAEDAGMDEEFLNRFRSKSDPRKRA